MRALIDKLPCPIKVLELRFDRSRHPHLHDDVCPVFVYDLSRLGQWNTQSLGVADAYDSSTVRGILERGGLTPTEVQSFIDQLQRDAQLVWTLEAADPPTSLQFLFYDPRRNPDQFRSDLTMHLRDWLEAILPLNNTTMDYLSLYAMDAKPILPLSQLLEADPRIRSFVKWSEEGPSPMTVEDLQQRVSRVLLIPVVPESAQDVFARARDLYVFGYFRYEFFTIAQHQASLALEATIKHRYCQSLGAPIILQTSAGNQITLERPDYERIWDVWKREGRQRLLANERPFPASMRGLLDWLVKNRIITKWERKRCDYYRELRNILSHPTYAMIDLPGRSLSVLREVAELINKVYHTPLEALT